MLLVFLLSVLRLRPFAVRIAYMLQLHAASLSAVRTCCGSAVRCLIIAAAHRAPQGLGRDMANGRRENDCKANKHITGCIMIRSILVLCGQLVALAGRYAREMDGRVLQNTTLADGQNVNATDVCFEQTLRQEVTGVPSECIEGFCTPCCLI